MEFWVYFCICRSVNLLSIINCVLFGYSQIMDHEIAFIYLSKSVEYQGCYKARKLLCYNQFKSVYNFGMFFPKSQIEKAKD